LWTYVRTDVRTDGRTFLPGLLGHLGGDDLKMHTLLQHIRLLFLVYVKFVEQMRN